MLTAGSKLKETGTNHWAPPNMGATNETGFTALPGGYRQYEANGEFSIIGYGGLWWSTNPYNNELAWFRAMNTNDTKLYKSYFSKYYGCSVRCIKN